MAAAPPSDQVTPIELSKVSSVYHKLREVFSKDGALSLSPHRPYNCAIELLPGAPLPSSRLCNLSCPEREAMEKYIAESLSAGIIRPSTSPLGAVFLVEKKDMTLCPCIDFHGLNKITVKNKYPLPLIDAALGSLKGAQVFTKLDAYHLVRIRNGDEWKTAFNTPLGHFEYLVMPFGLTNAPAVFQALINDVHRDFINHFVVVYLDDILVYSGSMEEHFSHVRQVLTRLLENRLFLKAEKCAFHVDNVSFLGYIIQRGSVKADPEKIRAVKEWPVPKTHKELQRFLRFANFYRRFIWDYSKIASPLSRLTSINVTFCWSPEGHTFFFLKLKQLVSSAPVLVQLNPSKEFIVEVDASGGSAVTVWSHAPFESLYLLLLPLIPHTAQLRYFW